MHVLCHHPKSAMISFLDKADENLSKDGIMLICDNRSDVHKIITERYNTRLIGQTQLLNVPHPSMLFECRKK